MAVRKIITEDGGYIKFENDEEYYAYLQKQAELRRQREEAEMARAIKKTIIGAMFIIPIVCIVLCSPKAEKKQETVSRPVKTQLKTEEVKNQPVQTLPVANQSKTGVISEEPRRNDMPQLLEISERQFEILEDDEIEIEETELEEEVRPDFSRQKIYQNVEVDEEPQFPGGERGLLDYIAENVVYPQTAIEEAVQGRVFVNFIVEPDGSVSNAKVLRGIGYGCDEEAVRVIESLLTWEPGRRRDKEVRVAMTVPVNFKLQ